MPEALLKKLRGQKGVRNEYAVANAMGAMKGSKTTAKGHRIEKKLRLKKPWRNRNMKEAGDSLAESD
jgi:hypothetical protein